MSASLDPASSATPDEPCELLAWDSAFFGVTTARVRRGKMRPGIADEIDRWCRQNAVRWLYFLSDDEDPETARCAEQRGYELVDVRMTFARHIADEDAAPFPIVAPFIETDLPAILRIAATAFGASRFYHDARIPKPKCDELFIHWSTAECHGGAEQVLVAHEKSQAVGFVTCHIDQASRAASIGLIGVEQRSRGRGVGRDLVASALAWAAHKRLRRITVVTQARNTSARQLYERCGFVPERAQHYFHKWYD